MKKTVILDFDGIFTTGFVSNNQVDRYSGKIIIPGIQEAIRSIAKVADIIVLSGSNTQTSLNITRKIATGYGISTIECGVFDKTSWIMKNGYWNSNTIYLGDDIDDVRMHNLAESMLNSPTVYATAINDNMTIKQLALELNPPKMEMPIQDFINIQGNNILIHQQYSMRSYETDKYTVMADGNFARMRTIIENASDDKVFTVTVPHKENLSDADEFKIWCLKNNVYVVHMQYGENAATNNTEARLPDYLRIAQFDTIITFFPQLIENLSSYKGQMVYMMNVSPGDENKHLSDTTANRKEFQRRMLLADITLYYNDSQQYLSDFIDGRIIKVTEIVDIENFRNEIDTLPLTPAEVFLENINFPKKIYYFPYRCSDPDYDFEGLLENGYHVIVTDPNDSVENDQYILNLKLFVKDEHKRMSSYLLHRYFLKAMQTEFFKTSNEPEIVLASNVHEVFHSTPVEMDFYLPIKIVRYRHAGYNTQEASVFVK